MRSLRPGACLVALALTLPGCATHTAPTRTVDPEPPSARLRARMQEGVIVGVVPVAPAGSSARDRFLRGRGESAGYAAKKFAKVGAAPGAKFAADECNVAKTGLLWFITCPVGLVGGAAMGVSGAVVGGVTGAAYGATTAHSKEQADAALAALDALLKEIEPGQAVREKFVAATRYRTRVMVRDDPTSDEVKRAKRGDGPSPVIMTLQVDEFVVVRHGALTPELSLRLRISAALHDAPEAGGDYVRSWAFDTKLGDFYALTDHGGARLRRAIDTVLRTAAETMVKDLFVSSQS